MNKNYRILLLNIVTFAIIGGSVYVWNFLTPPEKILSQINKDVNVTDKSLEGKWVLEGAIQDHSGNLVIKNQTQDTFSFSLDSYNGVHVGSITGEAKITSSSASSVVGDSENRCQVTFNRTADRMKLETTNSDCFYFRGSRAFFAGTYIKNGAIKERTLQDIVRVVGGGGPDEADLHIFKNNNEINAFQKLVGPNYVKLFTDSFQLVFRKDDTENLNARIYTGGVEGLYTITEGIIIVGSPDRIWVAAIDDDAVRYFTNVPDYANRLPETIEKWRERFLDKKVIFMSAQ